ncbi:PspC domain-containing protein [Ruminococcus sp.]
MISGVCAGLAEYFNIDVNIVRICAVLIGCAGGAGVIAYIAAAMLLPER